MSALYKSPFIFNFQIKRRIIACLILFFEQQKLISSVHLTMACILHIWLYWKLSIFCPRLFDICVYIHPFFKSFATLLMNNKTATPSFRHPFQQCRFVTSTITATRLVDCFRSYYCFVFKLRMPKTWFFFKNILNWSYFTFHLKWW